jgi:hypothetical protein
MHHATSAAADADQLHRLTVSIFGGEDPVENRSVRCSIAAAPALAVTRRVLSASPVIQLIIHGGCLLGPLVLSNCVGVHEGELRQTALYRHKAHRKMR